VKRTWEFRSDPDLMSSASAAAASLAPPPYSSLSLCLCLSFSVAMAMATLQNTTSSSFPKNSPCVNKKPEQVQGSSPVMATLDFTFSYSIYQFDSSIV
jgi:hypothetical protein